MFLGFLKGVQQNWGRWKGAELTTVVQEDVNKLVEYMAWVRNHIRASKNNDIFFFKIHWWEYFRFRNLMFLR